MSVPRRLRLAFACLVAALAGCGDGPPAVAPPPADATPRPVRPLLVGGDVSALARLEASGATYRDATGSADAISILARNGAGIFRLRLFVAPDGDGIVVNDLAYTVALARRVRASGARLLLALHYSDTWADPGRQSPPAAWAGLDADALTHEVERYTSAVLDTLRAAGALPDIVQIGNEIDGGFLWPAGRIGGPGFDDDDAVARFGRLLAAAARGVRGATTPADSVRILVHHSQGGDANAVAWFLAQVEAAAVPYDLVGVSYYPWWHGGLDGLRATLRYVAQVRRRDVLVVETSYPWDASGIPAGTAVEAMAWPTTPAGQREFAAALVAVVRDVPDGRGVGLLWWYPEAVLVPDLFIWGNGALGLFDRGGRLLPAASALAGRP